MHDANLDEIASLFNTSSMSVKIKTATIHKIELKTRMPFKYGIATMTEVPMIFVRVEIETNEKKSSGIASDLLPPKWFTKAPNEPIENEIAEMLRVIRNAIQLSVNSEAENLFALWRLIYDSQTKWAQENSIPTLLAHFGTSLVERAIIEATCKHHSQSLGEALLKGSLGFSASSIHPNLKGIPLTKLVPPQPLTKVTARHTIGLGDVLFEKEISDDDRLDDSLPQSLEQCIRYYKLKQFKIKISGDLEWDSKRLIEIATVITKNAEKTFKFSLDGNEQFDSIVAFQNYWMKLSNEKRLTPFFNHLLFIEQPLHRDIALESSLMEEFNQWPDRPPVIIDESDSTLKSLPEALHIGYSGTSHKNCKGIFKGIANSCLLENRRQNGLKAVISGEDLCNVGPIAVIQDLAVMAILGIESVERNGHHYMAGLSQFPYKTQTQILDAHPKLYSKSTHGWPTLEILNGQIDLSSINNQPFGTGFDLDLSVYEEISISKNENY
jgi:L-alanine-DL-glutamate epimerase-like enolase superfamily enzyme